MKQTKSFEISKQAVYGAYLQVKANKGAAGVDEQTLTDFEINLKNNLYKIWNRMSSGTYFPPNVKRVDIPKLDGGIRPLGIPTVGDRIAQTVVKNKLEPQIENQFHSDSYGYRPGKSALDAIGLVRERCWKYDWLLDLDIQGFFDNIDHELMMKAVRKQTNCKWMLLYIERWITASVQDSEGNVQNRDKGTPQGGVISPLLANLFLHYAFDMWMKIECPDVLFARYADDIVCHCQSEEQAKEMLGRIDRRLAECGLKLHPGKTRIVYCKDNKRRKDYKNMSFDFLGYTFRPRKSRTKWGKLFLGFNPEVSTQAKKRMRQRMREWNILRRSSKTIEDVAEEANPVIRGWIQYYGRYRKSGLLNTLWHLDRLLVKWARKKYEKLRSWKKAWAWLNGIKSQSPQLFTHWKLLIMTER